jgi:hypothetical protein
MMRRQRARAVPSPPRSRVTDPVVAVWAASAAAILVLRLVYVHTYRIDTDEPQHLHVIWEWVRGRVQYRDVFDNHAPLFHLLLAPLAAAVGERPEILVAMRLAMIPLSALALWGTYGIGRATFGRRVGAWAVPFAGLVPGFFLVSVEFRADALWAALWLVALAVLLGRPLTGRRAFVAGLLLGATLCTSLKTVLLLLALGAASGAAIAGAPGRLRRACPRLLAAALGFAIVPAAVTLFFASRGAFTAMVQATITHNVVGGVPLERSLAIRLAALTVAVPLWWWIGACVARSTNDVALGARRRVLALTAIGYVALLEGCWPVVTRQDFEPWAPLVAVLATAAGFAVLDRLPGRLARLARSRAATATIGGAVALAEIALLLATAPPWHARVRVDPALLADVLRLTRPSDTIMDLKGETVFRDRPFYYVLERLTLERLDDGSIPDTIAEAMIARRTCVAVNDIERLPPRARTFIRRNYLPIGRLRIAGRVLAPASRARRSITFHVRVPARYAILSGRRAVDGWLDGRRYAGPVFLPAGRHRLRAAPSAAPLALIWAPAVERGFTPSWLAGAA